MKRKHIILFILVVILIAIFVWPSGNYKIKSVEDGNLVKLDNGTRVKLIGISPTQQGKAYLEDNYIGASIKLKGDHLAPFREKGLSGKETIYAYVCDKNGHCINAELLRLGKAELLEGAYLSDSLKSFRKYALLGENDRTEPLVPTPAPVIKYEDDDIHLPKYDFEWSKDRKYSHWFTDGSQNVAMLDEVCDYNLPYTKAFANDLAGKSPGNFNPGQICEIFCYCLNNWRYVNDPKGQEYVAKASESIAGNLCGDCDDFAVLMATCMLSVGGEVTITTGFNPDSGHAYAEVDIASFKDVMLDAVRKRFPQYTITMLNTREDGSHLWLNLDWQASYPGGPYWKCAEKDVYEFDTSTGKWLWKGSFNMSNNVSTSAEASRNATVYDAQGKWFATGFLVESSSKIALQLGHESYDLIKSDKEQYNYKAKDKEWYVK